MTSPQDNNKDALARLLDESAVRDATARFAVAATVGDLDTFRAMWEEDAEWIVGGTEQQPFERRAHGVDDIVDLFRSLREERGYFVQFAVQGPIEIDGDQTTSTSVCHEAARGTDSYYRTNGIWTDRLRRTDTGWVFSSRTYRYLWLDLSPFTGDVSWA